MLNTPIHPWGPPPGQPPSTHNRFSIYRHPLPVRAHPELAEGYATLYERISSYFSRPSSHPATLHTGYYDAATQSVHVTDPVAVRALWEQGFFGKGSLSRSEPEWVQREKRRLGLLDSTGKKGKTSADVTKKRRQERREVKMERARAEAEAVQAQLETERQAMAESQSKVQVQVQFQVQDPNAIAHQAPVSETAQEEQLNGAVGPGGDAETDEQMAGSIAGLEIAESTEGVDEATGTEDGNRELAITDQEHLQLSAVETFFLTFSLGVLTVLDPTTSKPLSITDLFWLFRQVSFSPPKPRTKLAPDDPFILSYVVYHHFRSLAWVVRPGMKFAVDYLLYHRGPVFAHAEFAVLILPSYSHPYWKDCSSSRQEEIAERSKREWWWLLGANRVQTQVRKTLILAYVDIPPPVAQPAASLEKSENDGEVDVDVDADVDVEAMLRQYRIREIVLKRWSPNRNRD